MIDLYRKFEKLPHPTYNPADPDARAKTFIMNLRFVVPVGLVIGMMWATVFSYSTILDYYSDPANAKEISESSQQVNDTPHRNDW